MIDIVILDNDQEIVNNEQSKLVTSVLKFAYDFLKLKTNYEMSVNLVDNQKIQEINREFRNVDAPTDVISFALEEEDLIDLPDVPHELGDLFISTEKALEQAQELNHTVDREVAFLAVHGFLHLLGYDHTRSPEDEKTHFELQGKILEAYGLPR
ncbi:MAG: rRNA maturation RNase YbeY [Lactobacillaceae bacterium]|nr:rRNA maturation RNase YbeY [Lactobacillaceae bacterium]